MTGKDNSLREGASSKGQPISIVSRGMRKLFKHLLLTHCVENLYLKEAVTLLSCLDVVCGERKFDPELLSFSAQISKGWSQYLWAGTPI